MSNIQYLNYTHSFQLNRIEIVSNNGKIIDLAGVFNTLFLYENIFNIFLAGTIIIEDSIGLLQNLPIVGNEKILFSFATDNVNLKTNLEFYVYKIDRDTSVHGNDLRKSKQYTLYFTTLDAINDKKIKLSKKFSGTPDTIINNILAQSYNSSYDIDIDSCNNNLEIYSNFWNPSKVISFAAAQASGAYNDYVFFQTIEGYKFKSISNLLSQTNIYDIKYQNLESKKSRQDIQSYAFNSYFDYIENAKDGVLGSTVYQYNLSNNTFSKIEKTFTDITDKYTINGNVLNLNQDFFDSKSHIRLDHYNPDVSIYRNTIINHLKSYNMSVQLGGDSIRHAGQIYEFGGFSLDNESLVDPNFSGKWFSLAVSHIFAANLTYKQNIRLVKNGFMNLKNMGTPNGPKNP